MAPGLVRGIRIGLQESLTDRGGDHGVLALWELRHGVSDPMHATPLPAGAEHAGDGVAQPVMGIRDHQFDPVEAALDQPLEESRPERFRARAISSVRDRCRSLPALSPTRAAKGNFGESWTQDPRRGRFRRRRLERRAG